MTEKDLRQTSAIGYLKEENPENDTTIHQVFQASHVGDQQDDNTEKNKKGYFASNQTWFCVK